MLIIKKILLLITFLILSYVVFQLIIIRINLKKQFNEELTENFQEGFSLSSMFSSDQQSELINMTSNNKILIQNMNQTNSNLTIKDFCIKSSYNTAVSGNYVSTNAINYVISRGVRYIDFEIFYLDINNLNNNSKSPYFEPVVGFSSDPTFVQMNTFNVISLNDALLIVAQSGFSTTSPNYKDPLIINLRIKSNNQHVYSSVAKCIDKTIYSKLYVDPNKIIVVSSDLSGSSVTSVTRNIASKINKNTKIGDLLGKIIISFDITTFPNYEKSECDKKNVDNNCSYLLSNYINIENGGSDMTLSLYNYLSQKPTININKDGSTNIDNIYVAIPDSNYLKKNNINPNYGDWLLKYGYPIIPYQFYLNDSTLYDYEKFFNDNKSAFVPLADSITYFKRYLIN